MATGFDPDHGGIRKDWAGDATYFAPTLAATEKKAHEHGFCIEAQVYLGNCKEQDHHGAESLEQLNAKCYDSIHIHRKGGEEYAIYAADQMPRSLYKHVPC